MLALDFLFEVLRQPHHPRLLLAWLGLAGAEQGFHESGQKDNHLDNQQDSKDRRNSSESAVAMEPSPHIRHSWGLLPYLFFLLFAGPQTTHPKRQPSALFSSCQSNGAPFRLWCESQKKSQRSAPGPWFSA